MDITDTLRELIKRGEELVPQGGDPIIEGYNGALQPEYGSWRLQAISAIEELGRPSKPLLREIDSDKEGSYFYQGSAARVLGVLKAALAIAQRERRPTAVTTEVSAAMTTSAGSPGNATTRDVLLYTDTMLHCSIRSRAFSRNSSSSRLSSSSSLAGAKQ